MFRIVKAEESCYILPGVRLAYWGADMKKIIALCVFLLFAVFSIAAQNLPVISIVNNTGYTVFCVYISPSDYEDWGEDLLDSDEVLYDGETFTCQLPQPLSKVKAYDILLEDEDGDTYSKWHISVAANPRVIFTFDDLDVEE